MTSSTKRRAYSALSLACVGVAGIFLASCTTAPATKQHSKRSKEFFAESEYGVKASPRVTNKRTRLPRGGGRDQIGKPYVVKGKQYTPREEPNYVKTGAASWYGDAFHGRLTANGEIYDMTHLTAAHPTMPLPSYARVTNTVNGSSVIVRVNDRGPFANDRVIDLSKRAAELLDYTHAGVAKVKVEYVGRAPLHGQDDRYLMASYRPGPRDTAPAIAPNVMIAMNGATPSVAVAQRAPVAFPGQAREAAPPMPTPSPVLVAHLPPPAEVETATPLPAPAPMGVAIDGIVLPEFGPIVPERPPVMVAALSYADQRVGSAVAAFAALDNPLRGDAVLSSWKRDGAGEEPYVTLGSFDGRAEAETLAQEMASLGRVAIEADGRFGEVYTVNVRPDGRASVDDVLRAAWDAGATDAFVVRD